MPGLPVIDLDAVGLEHRIGEKQPGRFHVDDESGILVQARHVARQHDADLVGEDFLALVVDDAAAVAVAIEAERDVGIVDQHGVAHRVQHLHVFGVRIVAREGVIEIAIERYDLAANGFQHARGKGAGGAVAAGGDDLQFALELRPVGDVGDIAVRKILDEDIGAGAQLELGAEHDVLEPRHLGRPEGQRPVGAHLHAGPAIVVVRGGDHGDAGHVEIELGEIGHRRDAQADVMHLAAGRHQAGHQRHFHRRRIAAEIVSGDDLRLDAHFLNQGAEPHAQRLDAHQVDFFFQEPARVVFAKAGRLHQRRGLIGIGVRGQYGFRDGKHQVLGKRIGRGILNNLAHKRGKAVQNRARFAGYCSSIIRPLATS